MDVDDRLLLSYVDGELTAEERAATDALIAQSAELAERVAALRASCLPYRAAFEQVQLPDVPHDLLRRVDELVSVSRRQPSRYGRGRIPTALVAAFAAGVVVCSSLLLLLSGRSSDAQRAGSWLTAIVEYQNLYGRETVAGLDQSPSSIMRALSDLQHNTGMQIRVPDLREAGLEFKRMQQLDYRGQPLAQFVYLPQSGKPVALCVLKDPRPDEGLTVHTIDGMRTATWRRDHQTYVFLTSNGSVDVDRLARRIESGHIATIHEG